MRDVLIGVVGSTGIWILIITFVLAPKIQKLETTAELYRQNAETCTKLQVQNQVTIEKQEQEIDFLSTRVKKLTELCNYQETAR